MVGVLLVTLLWRLPSYFDPPWVNDEGTYFAVAQSMAHGYRLYADVWENKPPGLYLLYDTVYQGAGASLLTVRIIATLCVLCIVLLSFALGRSFVNERAGLVVSVLVGMLFGAPVLEGTTANAEVFLALFASLGVYLVFVRPSPLLGGIAMGIGMMFKAVAAFDLIALGLWLWLNRRSLVPRYVIGVVAVLAAVALLAEVSGILGAMVRDAVLYDLGYVGQGNGGGVPWLAGTKLAALVVISVTLRNRPFPVWWLVYATAGALLSGRIFGHYLLQMALPLALCLSLLLRHRVQLAKRLLPTVPAGFAALAALSAVIGWGMMRQGNNSILARRLQWYPNFVRLALGAERYDQYRNQVDDHVNRNIRIAREVSRLPTGKLLIWGNIPWVYVLSNRLPATPYTSAVRSPKVPGETASLRRAVIERRPRVVVVVGEPEPPFGSAREALARHYRVDTRIGNATVYVSVA